MIHTVPLEIEIPRFARNVKKPWTIEFTWHDLLFLHWPVPAASLRGLVPESLELDLYDGSAWVGVIPFFMSGIRLRGLPLFPGTSAFAEVNVRTYVRFRGQPGVYFFSLDAASFFAVRTARLWYHLPYFHARMSVENQGDTVRYSSQRRD
ncbi:MAG: YqjF family protein, partial [Terriglobales bacterium]